MQFYEREVIAQHEAAHAVAAVVLGWSLRYVTLWPRGGFSGTTWATPPRHSDYRMDAGAIYLAGMVAEQHLVDDPRTLVAGSVDDLRETRNMARHLVTHPPERFDANWSEWDVGAQMWTRARDLVAEYRPAVDWVADQLRSSRRAVPGSFVRHAVAHSPRSDEPAEPDEWWVPNYSRLRWRKQVA